MFRIKNAHLVEMVDTSDLKSDFIMKYWFKSNNEYCKNTLMNSKFKLFLINKGRLKKKVTYRKKIEKI